MVFTSHIFLFYFLPLILLIYYLIPRGRNIQLLIASYIFYGWWEPWFALLMFAATAVTYWCGLVIARSESALLRRAALIASIISSLSILAFFKYFVFFQINLNYLLEFSGAQPFTVMQIVLPLGISFYTFQAISYTVDLYRHEAPPARSFLDFACYKALFPQLVAGPIVRYQTIADQMVVRSHNAERFASGAILFMLGFSKKILLANEVAHMADAAFAARELSAVDAWVGVIAYAFQIYFDFSAYSDMALGLGRMFGFELPINFNDPYKSASITEFWRRWHISLSTFLRDYLYIPLGGNRKGRVRTYVNLLIVMLLGGLWHGANWTFVAWGAFHGLLLAMERALGEHRPGPRFLWVTFTFVLVLLSWVLFRSLDIHAALEYYAAMLNLRDSQAAPLVSALMYSPAQILAFTLCVVFTLLRTQALHWARQVSIGHAAAAFAVFLISVQTMWFQAFNPFLYFQF